MNHNLTNSETLHTEQPLSDGFVNGIRKVASSENMEIYEVEDTPFHIGKDEHGHTVLFGMCRLSQPMKDLEEAVKDAQRKDWNRITQVIEAGIRMHKAENNLKEL